MTMRSVSPTGTMAWRLVAVLLALTLCLGVSAKKKPKHKTVQPVAVPQLSANDARRFSYFYLEAVRQQQVGNYAAAYDLFRHCLSINPMSAETYFALSSYYAEMQVDSAMLACMQRAADLSPVNNTYLEHLGKAYIRTHDYERATDIYERLADISPGRTDVLTILLQLYQHSDNYDKLLATLEKIETIEGSSEDLTLSKMQVYALKGDKKQELGQLRSLAKQHPNDYNYRVMIGNWLLQNGKKKEALAEYNAVLKKEPGNIMAQMSLLDYYKAEGQDSLAKEQTEALLLSPATETDSKIFLMRQMISNSEQEGGDSTEVLNLFGRILDMPQENAAMAELCAAYMSVKHMPEDTISTIYERILGIEPDNVGARLELLQTAWRHHDYDRIIALSKPAIEYSPDNIWFYYFLGLAYSQKDDNDNALDTFRKGVSQVNAESNKDMVSDFYTIMGDILHEKGLNDEAYAAYDSCLQWKPDNISCLNNYAYFLSVEGRDLAKAEAMSYRTVKAEPGNATYLDTYAWILFRQQRFEEARIYIDQALEADTAHSSVITEHAGDIYMMAGKPEKALELWQKALEAADESDDNVALLRRKIQMKKYINDIDDK